MHDDDAFRLGRLLGELAELQDGIELFVIQVVKYDLVAVVS
jgi:hypothetical protein